MLSTLRFFRKEYTDLLAEDTFGPQRKEQLQQADKLPAGLNRDKHLWLPRL